MTDPAFGRGLGGLYFCMKKSNIDKLFPKAKSVIQKANKDEIREGWLVLDDKEWRIKDGILIAPNFSFAVKKEQQAIKVIDQKPELGGNIKGGKKDFFEALENLPSPLWDNPYFQTEGAFLNISLGEKDYLDFINQLKGSLEILEIGADSGWSAAKLSQKHQVMALDISDHLFLRDFWLQKDRYFEAVKTDMHELPFQKESFDLIFASAAIHHSSDLKKVAGEFFRVLKKGGFFMFLREPMRGKWARSDFGRKQKTLGVSENLYSKEEWQAIFQKAGFRHLKIELSYLEYPYSQKYFLKMAKKNLLKSLPMFQNLTVSDYNFSGQKPRR